MQQITKILNAHMDSLLWIDRQTGVYFFIFIPSYADAEKELSFAVNSWLYCVLGEIFKIFFQKIFIWENKI